MLSSLLQIHNIGVFSDFYTDGLNIPAPFLKRLLAGLFPVQKFLSLNVKSFFHKVLLPYPGKLYHTNRGHISLVLKMQHRLS